MLSNATNDDLENFLKKSSEGLRMHPSKKVWKNISKNLNQTRRQVGIATSIFLLIASLLGYFLIPGKDAKLVAVRPEANNFSSPSFRLQDPRSRGNAQQTQEAGTLPHKNTKSKSGATIKPLYPLAGDSKFQKDIELSIAEQPAQSTETFYTSIVDSDPEATLELPQMINVENNDLDKTGLLTIESVTNAYQLLMKKKKLSFQFFFAPTISYRKLSENKSYIRSVPQTNASPNYAVLYNVNDAVTHKPDIGLELGFTAKYPVAKNLKLKAGFQFNVSRYDIKAYNSTTELATIALNTGQNRVQMHDSRSNHRNFGSTTGKVDWLQNLYFQASMPIGAEVKVAGNEKTSFGLGTTIQPGYVLSDRAYLLSTDYKNYTEVPELIRRWNVNTNIEAFVSYSTGKMNWQVGPQVRYQLLSSFVTEYPVKENLFDFSLKIGLSLNDKKSSENTK